MNQENKTKNIFTIATVIVVIIFLLTVIFGIKEYYKPQPPETQKYNSFTFTKQGPIWYTNWQRSDKTYSIGLRHNPKEVEHIPITGNFSNDFNKKNKIYITFDPFSENSTFKYQALAASELATHLAGPLGREPVAACTRGEQMPACKERPTVNCDNKELNIIMLKIDDKPKITLNNTCITIQGNNDDIIKSAEKTLYVWFGIIKQGAPVN